MLDSFLQETTGTATGIEEARRYAARLLEYAPEGDARENVARALSYVPPGVLELLVRNETRIVVTGPGHDVFDVSPTFQDLGEQYREISERMAGVYIAAEHRIVLRKHDEHPAYLVHEVGHAFDHALLRERQKAVPDKYPPGITLQDVNSLDDVKGISYLSSLNGKQFDGIDLEADRIAHAWSSGQFVSAYAARGTDEMFAEAFRAYCDTGSPEGMQGVLGTGTRASLVERAPSLDLVLRTTIAALNRERELSLAPEQAKEREVAPILDAPESPDKGKKRDLRTELTEKIVESLDRGVVPWAKPWVDSAAPHNGISERPYHGGNRLMLRLVAQEKGYSDPRWMTFNQARENGWMVAKGEKGVRVEYWKPPELKTKGDEKTPDGREEPNENASEKTPQRGWRVFTAVVFNAEQIVAPVKDADNNPVLERIVGEDGIAKERPVMQKLTEVLPFKKARDFVPIERAQQIVESVPAVVEHGGDRAYYRPSTDQIQLPLPESFKTTEAYYATRLHETAHWTGHESRLNREGITSRSPFGSEIYAKEELRAELASVFLAQEIGVALDESHFANHAAYIKSWAKDLRENKHEIFAASRDAEKMADYILELAERGRELALTQEKAPEIVLPREVSALAAPEWHYVEGISDGFGSIRHESELTRSPDGSVVFNGDNPPYEMVDSLSTLKGDALRVIASYNTREEAELYGPREHTEFYARMLGKERIAEIDALTARDYQNDLTSKLTLMYSDQLGPDDELMEPSASKLYEAIASASERHGVEKHPALQGLASALHDVGIKELSEQKVRLLVEATGDLVLEPVPVTLTSKQRSDIEASLTRRGVDLSNNAAMASEAADQFAIDYYLRSGAATLEIAEQRARDNYASREIEPDFDLDRMDQIDFDGVRHDLAFEDGLSALFGAPDFTKINELRHDKGAHELEMERVNDPGREYESEFDHGIEDESSLELA